MTANLEFRNSIQFTMPESTGFVEHRRKLQSTMEEREQLTANLQARSMWRQSKKLDKLELQKLVERSLSPSVQGSDNLTRSSVSSLKGTMWTKLCTGSSYRGRWNQFGFNGYGFYRYADGLMYVGTLSRGHFHGSGELLFENGNRIKGYWEMGINKHMKFSFADGLKFEEENWAYCTETDRRYAMSEIHKMNPIGEHTIVPTRHHPKPVPHGCYYTSTGYYNPTTKYLHRTQMDPETELFPQPEHISAEEAAWIEENCARADHRDPIQMQLIADNDKLVECASEESLG